MKKITLITASVLALAAATVGAQTSDQTTELSQPQVEMASLSVEDTPLRGASSNDTAHDQPQPRRIRFVVAPETDVDSCDRAAWPYYPAECLQRVDMSGL